MSGSPGFILSERLVLPVLLPIFFVLVIAASMLIQW